MPRDYNCAIGAVYAALAAIGKSPELGEVARCFPEKYRADDVLVPMSVLCEVLRKQGVPANAIRVDVPSVESSFAPALLLVFPAGLHQNAPGHYVLLKSVAEADVVIVDPEDLLREHRVPKAQLYHFWGGYAISLSRTSRWHIVITAFIIALAGYEVFAALLSFVKVTRRPPSTLGVSKIS